VGNIAYLDTLGLSKTPLMLTRVARFCVGVGLATTPVIRLAMLETTADVAAVVSTTACFASLTGVIGVSIGLAAPTIVARRRFGWGHPSGCVAACLTNGPLGPLAAPLT